MSVTLRWPRPQLEDELGRIVSEGRAILEQARMSTDEAARAALREAWLAWVQRGETLLDQAFETKGFLESGPRGEFTTPAVSVMDLRLTSARTIPVERLTDMGVAPLEGRQAAIGIVPLA